MLASSSASRKAAAALLSSSRIISTARLARQMEWNRRQSPDATAALCLWVGHQTTSLALGFHPAATNQPPSTTTTPLVSTPTANSSIPVLQATLDHYERLPLVVGWPLQRETGTCGQACGRVLHVLDQLTSNTTTASRRTLTLYTPPTTVVTNNPIPDAFGRQASYSRTSTKQCHIASHDQYTQHAFPTLLLAASQDNNAATEVWRMVCADVWPDYTTTATDDDDDATMMMQHGDGYLVLDESAWLSDHTTTTTTTSTLMTASEAAGATPSLIRAA